MGLVLKYVQRTKTGRWRYRRRVPDQLQSILGKREFVRSLGETERQALRSYPRVHAEAEAQLRSAVQQLVERKLADSREATPSTRFEAHAQAMKLLVEYGYDVGSNAFDSDDNGHDWAIRTAIADQIASKYPEDEEGHPVGVSPRDTEAVRILYSMGSQPSQPPPTLLDAKRLYIEERVTGTRDEPRKCQRVDRVCKFVTEALGRNPLIAELKRQDARAVRDFMLAKRGMRPATAQRYLNDIRAIITLAIDHFDLERVRNPFNKLRLKIEGHPRNDRRSFNDSELRSARESVLAGCNQELGLIWRILEGTGCRLKEVAGLLTSDVVVSSAVPHLSLRQNPHRSLKTPGSARQVPLVGDALEAAKSALALDRDDDRLFPRYCRDRGADAASAALMKRVRRVVSDKKVTVHSLRHLMKDRLRSAGVDPSVQDAILGHSSGRVADHYGSQEAILRLAREGLVKALAIGTED